MGRHSNRQLLDAGRQAPDFRLRDRDGVEVSFSGLLANGPVLLAFFKISCPVCQMIYPYLERLYRGGQGIQIVGISQDGREGTAEFAEALGITLPILLDEAGEGYPVSNAYGISSVPTLYLVEPDGVISYGQAGFSRADLERLGHRMHLPVFRHGEHAPDWRAG
ncbi:MAG: peroxiredoxin family protein [Acidobacteria bacterium]|nr:peroxiredoxin family protein [Acidobacteriota bacterium]